MESSVLLYLHWTWIEGPVLIVARSGTSRYKARKLYVRTGRKGVSWILSGRFRVDLGWLNFLLLHASKLIKHIPTPIRVHKTYQNNSKHGPLPPACQIHHLHLIDFGLSDTYFGRRDCWTLCQLADSKSRLFTSIMYVWERYESWRSHTMFFVWFCAKHCPCRCVYSAWVLYSLALPHVDWLIDMYSIDWNNEHTAGSTNGSEWWEPLRFIEQIWAMRCQNIHQQIALWVGAKPMGLQAGQATCRSEQREQHGGNCPLLLSQYAQGHQSDTSGWFGGDAEEGVGWVIKNQGVALIETSHEADIGRLRFKYVSCLYTHRPEVPTVG